ncbi:hypothetical protein IPV08_16965 [Methylobacterium sp. SD274]|uniref:hypothetical protein n=1 Tax=Methylobacterium sp. SD274 TaxID=2782009 RepID=UPI001A965EDF|nr:hypothetical protein [Methylobacterium sp. SD274]MBO1021653.1 hypothetical protein [Methylobacterium sp. SD274]
MAKTTIALATVLLIGNGVVTAAEDETNPRFCYVVADTLDKATVRTKVLLKQVEDLHLSGLAGQLRDKDDQAAYDAALKARVSMMEAARHFQAAYEDLAYRMKLCARR